MPSLICVKYHYISAVNEEPFKKKNNYLPRKPAHSGVKDANYNNKEEPYFVPVYNYAPERAYYNPEMRVKPSEEDELVNIARNNEKQANVERIPIYDYSAKNAYFNPHNRLGPDPDDKFAARSKFVREGDKNEPEVISEAELQRILKDNDEISREEKARIENIGKNRMDYRNEPDEISESEMRKILREDDVPLAGEVQEIMKESGATKVEVIDALRNDSKSKDILRNADIDIHSFVFPPHEKSHPLRITPIDLQHILDDDDANSYANVKLVSHDNFENKVYSAPHRLDVDIQKLLQDDVPRLKHIITSRDQEDSAMRFDRWEHGDIRKSLNKKLGLFSPQKIVLDLQKFSGDPRVINILKARSNDQDLGVFDTSENNFESGSSRKSTPRKLNFVFRSIVNENSRISDTLEKVPIEKLSTDYFDFDYYFGRREQGPTGDKKSLNINNGENLVRSRHKKLSKYFKNHTQ